MIMGRSSYSCHCARSSRNHCKMHNRLSTKCLFSIKAAKDLDRHRTKDTRQHSTSVEPDIRLLLLCVNFRIFLKKCKNKFGIWKWKYLLTFPRFLIHVLYLFPDVAVVCDEKVSGCWLTPSLPAVSS